MATSAQGDVVAAERWRAAVDGSRGSFGALEPLVCFYDALTGVNGVDAMLADARCAIRELGRDSSWYPSALVLEGLALLVSGEEDAAIEVLQYAAEAAERYGTLPAAAFALAACSLHVGARGAPVKAGELAAHAGELLEGTDLERHATCALTPVAVARWQMQRGDPGAARRTLQQAYSLMPLLTWALPVISMYTLLEMADTAIGLADIAGARQILREASRIVRKRPLGRLDDRFRTLQDLLDTLPTGDTGVSTLTAAELRLLPHLATHLSFPEIGESLYISRHTVKTQAMAIYRKLGASTRSEAVAAAREVGLLPVREV